MAPNVIRVRLCPRKHTDHPFKKNNSDGSDTCRIDLGQYNCTTLDGFRQLWLESMEADFDMDGDILRGLSSDKISFHDRKRDCKETLSLDVIKSEYGTQNERFAGKAKKKVICVHIDVDYWGNPGASAEQTGSAKQAKATPNMSVPKELEMALCRRHHPEAPDIIVLVDLDAGDQPVDRIEQIQDLFTCRMIEHPDAVWPSVHPELIRFLFHSAQGCGDSHEIEDLGDILMNYLRVPGVIDDDKIVCVHLMHPDGSTMDLRTDPDAQEDSVSVEQKTPERSRFDKLSLFVSDAPANSASNNPSRNGAKKKRIQNAQSTALGSSSKLLRARPQQSPNKRQRDREQPEQVTQDPLSPRQPPRKKQANLPSVVGKRDLSKSKNVDTNDPRIFRQDQPLIEMVRRRASTQAPQISTNAPDDAQNGSRQRSNSVPNRRSSSREIDDRQRSEIPWDSKSRTPAKSSERFGKKDGFAEFPDLDEDRHFVRVGHIPSKQDDNGIPRRLIVVAVVDGNNVKYHVVETWRINGKQIGDYPSAEVEETIDKIRHFEPDTFWTPSHKRGALDAAVLIYVQKDLQPAPVTDRLDWQRLDGVEIPRIEIRDDDPAKAARVRKSLGLNSPARRPFRAPINPIHTLGLPASQVPGAKSSDTEDVAVVICFANYATRGSLHTPTNLQAFIDHNMSWSAFKRFIKHVEISNWKPGTIQRLVRDSEGQKYWLAWDIWVLPQWEEKSLYPWKQEDGKDVSDFLDKDVTAIWGKHLFVVIRFKSDDQSAEKKKIWKDIGSKYPSSRDPKYGLRKKVNGKRVPSDPLLIDDSTDNSDAEQNVDEDDEDPDLQTALLSSSKTTRQNDDDPEEDEAEEDVAQQIEGEDGGESNEGDSDENAEPVPGRKESSSSQRNQKVAQARKTIGAEKAPRQPRKDPRKGR